MGTEGKSTLELTVISATDLKKVRTFNKEQYYVVAYVDERRKVSSKVANDAGTNPTWNWKPCFAVKGTETVTVEIYSHGSFSNKVVGTSKISIRDVGTLRNSTTPMFYEVRRPSGKVKGALSVSMKLKSRSSVGKASRGMGYDPNSVKAESSPYYPLTTAGHRVDASNAAGSVYPPPKAGSAVPSSQVYPPLKASSSSTPSYGAGADGAQVYPPPMPSGYGRDGYSSKVDEPVMAYPAPDYAAFQYPPNQHGIQDTPQYYPYSQASAAPYNYQQAYYSKPQRPRRQAAGGRSGMGMGLMSGALGGLLLGDLMGGGMGGDMGGGMGGDMGGGMGGDMGGF